MKLKLFAIIFLGLFALSSASTVYEDIKSASGYFLPGDTAGAFFGQLGDSFKGFFSTGLSCTDPVLEAQKQTPKPSNIGGYIFNMLDFYSLTILSAVFIVFGVTLIYLAGKLFNLDNLVAIAKEEYWQSLLTVLRIFFIIITIVAANIWYETNKKADDPVYQNADNVIDVSMEYSKLMLMKITQSLGSILIFNTFLHSVYSATVYWGITSKAMFSFQLGPIFKPAVDIVGVLIQFLSVALGEWMLHFIVLCFIKKWTFSMLIPIAMFLRAFPQTRGGGDGLMALLFSFSLFYPMMFIVSYEIHKLMSTQFLEAPSVVEEFYQNNSFATVSLTALLFVLSIGSVLVPALLTILINVI
ncbi:hypothetical protein HZC08_02165, partial [Candidatus Micrarchaeota archaeon]|nr:hypothetical protein [Candidatus Micrarchaeota archaeon]